LKAVFVPAAIDLLALYAIKRGIEPGGNRRWDWLAWKPLQHVGVISYGLYVYHYFIPEGLVKFAPGIASLQHRFEAPIALAISFVLAETSWRLMEQPALKLKGGLHPSTRRPAALSVNTDN
jgi:peptidoglycan/LPS O-acetylase OafA/YrhL